MGAVSPAPALPVRWCSGEPAPELAVAVPPAPMARLRGGRPLKRWRYVAAFDDELMLCVGSVSVGGLRSSWWAVWDRARRILSERTRLGRGGVRFLDDGRVVVRDGGVTIDLAVDEGAGVESVNPHGAQYVWTRKQAGRPVSGRVTCGGRAIDLDGLAVVDDTAGYHARLTQWRWSAGVGRAGDGTPVGWNVVSGLNDAPRASERSVWIGDEPREVGPVDIAADLSTIAFAEGDELRFSQEAVRARRDRFLVLRSDYWHPFGTFAGSLPGVGGFCAAGGVMERHSALW